MKEPKFIIYALRDPRDGHLRYVGQSSTGLRRPKEHFKKSALDGKTYKARWVNSLVRIGLLPEIVVLQVLDNAEGLDEAECRWIAIGREAIGKRLTNATDGGEANRNPRFETRLKMSKSHKQAWAELPEEVRKKRVEKFIKIKDAYYADPNVKAEVREKLVISNKKSWKDPELRAERIRKMSEKRKQAWQDPEYRRRVTESNKSTWSREDKKQSMSEFQKKVWDKHPNRREELSKKNLVLWSDPEKKRLRNEKISATVRNKRKSLKEST